MAPPSNHYAFAGEVRTMHVFRLCSSVLPLALAIACGSPTETQAPSLAGTWVAAPENASPSGSYLRSLTFDATGSFSSGFQVYGIYPGEPGDEVSAYQRTEGTYQAEGNRLVFQAMRLVWWDRYYGVDSQERTVEPYPYGSIFDDARYELHGRQLTLHYTAYPADAPETSVLVFTLAR
jgi:hypothetical protein